MRAPLKDMQERHQKRTHKEVFYKTKHKLLHCKGLDLATCTLCLKAKRYSKLQTARKALQDLSYNLVHLNQRRHWIWKSRWGCICSAAVCHTDICWQEHLVEAQERLNNV
jgi:hypothetical protein